MISLYLCTAFNLQFWTSLIVYIYLTKICNVVQFLLLLLSLNFYLFVVSVLSILFIVFLLYTELSAFITIET